MKREGSCPCGAVRYSIDGPVRDVLVCHCDACCDATGGPWPAAAARRHDLVVEDTRALVWQRAPVSEHGARRGRCDACGTTLFWDAPGRATVSFGVATLVDQSGIEVAAHIWVTERKDADALSDVIPCHSRGLPTTVDVPWRA